MTLVQTQLNSDELVERVMAKEAQEVDLSTLTLEELVDRAHAEHALVERSLTTALLHAFEVGRTLIAVRERVGWSEWRTWRDANLEFKQAWASVYMRLAYYREHVIAAGAVTIEEGRRVTTGLPPIVSMAPPKYDGMEEEARRLSNAGHAPVDIAEMMGIALSTVHCYINDDYRRRAREKSRRAQRRRIAAKRALREQQEREERDRLARERGGNLGKAYDQIRKLQPIIDAAIAEGLTVEARALLVRVEDEIFKALKR